MIQYPIFLLSWTLLHLIINILNLYLINNIMPIFMIKYFVIKKALYLINVLN